MNAIASVLFVPGSRPERFAKALASGADLVCIDLEDAVPIASKAEARAATLARAADGAAIRINPITTAHGLHDLLAIAEAGSGPSLLFVPKVEDAAHLDIVAAIWPGPVVPLIETSRGLRNAPAIAAHPCVAAMMFGGGDLAGELGVALAWEPLAVARARFLLACAESGRVAIDVPWIALDDPEGLATECRRARALGFQAKAAIHPNQIATIAETFLPSIELIAEAREARAAYAEAGGAAVRFRGRMLEAPIMRRYERIIAQAEHRETLDA